MSFTVIGPKLFRGHPVLEAREGYVCISRRDGTEVWAKDDNPTHYLRCMPDKRVMVEYEYLFALAVRNNLDRPRLTDKVIAIPDWGTSFLQERLTHGWCGTVDDLVGAEQAAVDVYPYAVLWQVNVTDIVIPAGSRGVLVDSRYAMDPDRVQKEFPTLESYIPYVRAELERSWKEFLELHGDEIDNVSRLIDEHEGPCYVKPVKITWPT
jgi:hypothetical protein